MSRHDHGGWPAYVPVAKRRRQAEREAARLRKKGQTLAPVRVEGRAIAGTPWGKVAIGIAALPAARWRALCGDCAGWIDSLVELLQGRLSQGIMERMCRQGAGLFPKPSEIRFDCTCEDHASMCKHVAAALYGVGARLDERPELLFRLRGVDAGDLLAGLDAAVPASRSAKGRTLETEDVSALFGLDMAGSEDADGGLAGPPSRRAAPAARSRPEQARRDRPSPPDAAVPAKASVSASARKAGVAKPLLPGAEGFRPSPALAVPKQARPSASAPGPGAPAVPAARKRTAGQLGGAKELDQKAAEKAVADVIARIGQHLVMGVDVTRAEQGTPKAGTRGAQAPGEPITGPGARTPGKRKPNVGPTRRRNTAI